MYGPRQSSEPRNEPPIGGLVSDIVRDFRELIVEGATLTKLEVQDELGKAKTAAIEVGAGAVVLGIGALMLLLMIVHLLAALTAIPLWGCYGIVGGVLVVIGGILLVAGKSTVTLVGDLRRRRLFSWPKATRPTIRSMPPA
ncbi:MAG TPA: phage holin family protein [Candidatus Binatia bacterium]|nr:phage holin family protein [Candidatus Binatia bacterium]